MHRTVSPDTSDSAIEQEIVAKGLTAPRITPADIEANIIDEAYFTAEQGYQASMKARHPDLAAMGNEFPNSALGLLTFCVLTLRNGFTVTGESACASPENFDAELGRKIARANAVNKVWPLMGYQLRSMLAKKAEREAIYAQNGQQPPADNDHVAPGCEQFSEPNAG